MTTVLSTGLELEHATESVLSRCFTRTDAKSSANTRQNAHDIT